MTGEITRRSVLLECLSIMREELNLCSSKYNGLEPKKGMEEAWEQAREKVRILQELIQAYESEQVRAAIAKWQQEVMEHGAPKENNSEFGFISKPVMKTTNEVDELDAARYGLMMQTVYTAPEGMSLDSPLIADDPLAAYEAMDEKEAGT